MLYQNKLRNWLKNNYIYYILYVNKLLKLDIKKVNIIFT
jgi:hypothetical protein